MCGHIRASPRRHSAGCRVGRPLPRELRAAEVPMQCGVRVSGATKVQRVDDAARGQVEHVADGGGEDGVVRDAGAVRVDGHVGRLGDADP